MANGIGTTGSGISATTTNAPDFTFVWSASPQDGYLLVTCQFGTGTSTGNVATASVPVGSTTPVPMVNGQGNNPAISVAGSVQVMWSVVPGLWAVCFTGQMTQPGVNNVVSNTQVGGTAPIIVAASVF